MIEKTRYLDILSHLIVISGILLVAFPLWLTFVASTHGPGALFRAPVPFWPGDQLWTNYEAVLFRGVASVGGAPIGTALESGEVRGARFHPGFEVARYRAECIGNLGQHLRGDLDLT